MTTTATAPATGASAASTAQTERESLMLRRRIGSTMFIVNIRFSDNATETMADKIFRLIESEVRKSA